MGPYPLLPIARHAKELLEHASEHLQNGTEKDSIIALIHLDNAIEIMLKEYLRFNKNQPWRNIEDKVFYQLLDACVELGTIENNKSQFVAFHDIRNALYHAGTFAPRKEDVESALYFSKLLFNEMHPNFSFKDMQVESTSASTIDSLAKEFGRHRPYVTEASLLNKLAVLFNKQGYETKINPKLAGTSMMADLLLIRNSEAVVIEIKGRTKGEKVLNSAVFQLAGYVEAVRKAMTTKKVEGWLITNTNFSKAAITAARKLNIRLITDKELKGMLPRDQGYLY
jgi:CRISPR/Cas system-associated exonuclease Cas4 (RecB family)